ncbi:trans-Golgi network integral membrane protein 2 [Diachasma alloeum]|uniref:trans-Golgi network integral membrane protein 2 n=1 Tax=Diachasma alloeum TaxID=454923 RepID=UPI0007384FE5|nr:trans-Golgi network integral membrane protein 2 [Diachasma alloeum]
MLLKASIILSLLTSQCPKGSGAAAAPKIPSILETISSEVKNNKSVHICSTPKDILDSEYVKVCDKLQFPLGNAKLEGNYDTFLCLALYDRAFHICHASSRGFELPALQNKLSFDKLITDEIKNHETDPLKLCIYFEKIQPVFLEKTKPFVDALSMSLKVPLECVKICSKGDEGVNPLCLVIQVIDEEIQKEEEKKAEEQKKAEEKKKAEEEKKAEEKKKKEEKEKVLKEGKSEVQAIPKGTEAPKPAAPVVNPQVSDKPSGEDKPGAAGVAKDRSPVDDAKKAGAKEEAKADEKNKLEPVEKPEKVQEKPGGEAEGSVGPAQPSPAAGAKDNVGKKEERPKGQTVPAGPVQVEKSTLSANTGGDEDVQLRQDEGSEEGALGLPPAEFDYKEDGNQMSIPRNSGTVQENEPDSFDQPENIAKLPHITPDDDSHFFGYFTLFGLFGIGLFAAYHHKHKIFAMLLEGRRSRGGRGRRRPSTANYRKLDCTLEEAVTSQCSSNVTHVIY